MDEIDFGSLYGGNSSVTLLGPIDFNSFDSSSFNTSAYAPDVSINLPDFGPSTQIPDQISNVFQTELPNITLPYDMSAPPALADLKDISSNLMVQQEQIKKEAQDLLSQQQTLTQEYQSYKDAYNKNISAYNQAIKNSERFKSVRDRMAYGSPLYNLHNNNVNKYLQEASTYAKSINDAATKYQDVIKDYESNVNKLKSDYTDYQKNYSNYSTNLDKAKNVPVATTPVTPPVTPTPIAGPSETPVTTPVKPGPINVNIPEPRQDVPPVTEPTAPDLPPITVTPAPDPIEPEPPEPVEPEPPELPPVEPEPPPDEPKPPEEPKPKKPVDDFEITVSPIFPPDVGTLTKKKSLSKPLRTDTLSSTLLGTALQATPSSAEPYLLGTDEKAKNVWNVESLRNALGI
jgi:hypothetical protein